MLSRPTTDRQNLDLQNAESATAWILSFVAKCRAEKKEDKINTNDTVQELQVTNFFLSMWGQEAIIKIRSLISPRSLIDTPYKDIRLAIQNYISPNERVAPAEKAKFLSIMQGVGESDDDYLAHFGEDARFCDFENSKQWPTPKRSW